MPWCDRDGEGGQGFGLRREEVAQAGRRIHSGVKLLHCDSCSEGQEAQD